jgi:hypothetical protein
MVKSTAKHYPPAYYRYREKHPTVSIVLSKETKEALDKARGDKSYAKFLTSLITPDGLFYQLKKQKAQLASERVSLETEKKSERTKLASLKVSFETEKENQNKQLESEWVALETEKANLAEIERFSVRCPKCGKQMKFNNTMPEWNSHIKPVLQEMFQMATHNGCGK